MSGSQRPKKKGGDNFPTRISETHFAKPTKNKFGYTTSTQQGCLGKDEHVLINPAGTRAIVNVKKKKNYEVTWTWSSKSKIGEKRKTGGKR